MRYDEMGVLQQLSPRESLKTYKGIASKLQGCLTQRDYWDEITEIT